MMHDVTYILAKVEKGDEKATEELLCLVYAELRQMAIEKMAHEAPGHTLQPTALVHEAYLRLMNVAETQHWDSRGHFFAAAAEAMRRILIDQARRKRRQKRGGGGRRADLDPGLILAVPNAWAGTDLLALDDALRAFEAEEPMRARVVKLRFFAGLSVPDTAQALGISVAMVKRHWVYARSWLYRKIGGC